MRPLLALLLFFSLSAALAAQTDPVAAGDAAWARRAEGHQGGKALPGPIDEAIAGYERAVREQPDRLEGSWKLLRALHFKGDFATDSQEARQQAFARGKEVAEAAIDRLARRTAGGRQKLDALTPAQAAKAVAGVPEAKPLFLWAAVHWGLWGDVFGRLAAARQGVGDRVKRYAETLIALDERYEDAGGHRVLGRLHTLAPKVPFVTGWVDRGKAVSELRRAVALGPDNFDNHALPRRGPVRAPAGQGPGGARDPAPPARPPAVAGAGGRAGEEPRQRPGAAREASGLTRCRIPEDRLNPSPSRTPLIAVAAAAFLVALKGAGAWTTGSLALGSAALDSLIDVFISGANFLVLRRSALPPDEDHAYGHGKFENLAAFGSRALPPRRRRRSWCGRGVRQLIAGGAPEETGWGIAVLAVSLVVQLRRRPHPRARRRGRAAARRSRPTACTTRPTCG